MGHAAVSQSEQRDMICVDMAGTRLATGDGYSSQRLQPWDYLQRF